ALVDRPSSILCANPGSCTSPNLSDGAPGSPKARGKGKQNNGPTLPITSISYSKDGTRLVARDFMSVYVWDPRNTARPESVIPVLPTFEPHLQRLSSIGVTFDPFAVALSHDARFVLTGAYGNKFRLYDINGMNGLAIAASRSVRRSKHGHKGANAKTTPCASLGAQACRWDGAPTSFADAQDLERKIMHFDMHPTENVMAVATRNNLFLYASKN
ncbi:protein phosphatase 2A regulatory subunit PR55, partial [Kipferlia bialata]